MKDSLQQYFWVGMGGIVCAIPINLFLVPHHLLSGGVSGLATILFFIFGYPIGLITIAINIPLFYAAYRFIGLKQVFSALYGMLAFSLSIDATRFLVDVNMIDDPLLAALYGGILSGLGSGMIFRVNGNAGGLDIVAIIVKKFYGLNVGIVGFSVNCFIMLISAMLFGAKLSMLTLISMFVCAIVTDKVVEGFDRRKTITIISERSGQIAEVILSEVGRGVTFLQGKGAFTGRDKQVIFVVVNLTQISQIKKLVESIDPFAFMTVQDAVEVMGRGFTVPEKRQSDE